MDTEPTLFPVKLQSAGEAKRDAIDRVQIHADQDWYDRALAEVRRICQTYSTFTTDSVSSVILDGCREPRALGAVLREAARSGWCEPLNEYEESTNARCHGRPKRIWSSLL